MNAAASTSDASSCPAVATSTASAASSSDMPARSRIMAKKRSRGMRPVPETSNSCVDESGAEAGRSHDEARAPRMGPRLTQAREPPGVAPEAWPSGSLSGGSFPGYSADHLRARGGRAPSHLDGLPHFSLGVFVLCADREQSSELLQIEQAVS